MVLLATTAAATAAAAAPRPGQTPQHEQLNPNVAYRVANSVQPGAQFFMGGDGQSYFDVLTPPIRTRYAEVFWTAQPPVDLPADVVARFDGKAMAITGHAK